MVSLLCWQVDFLPDGQYQQDSITLEDQQRRSESFNAVSTGDVAGCRGQRGVSGLPA